MKKMAVTSMFQYNFNMIKIFWILATLLIYSSVHARVGTVVKMRGTIILKQPNKKALNLKEGDKIVGDALLISKARSFARVHFEDNSTLIISANSKLAIGQADPRKPKFIQLMKGKIRGIIDPKQNEKKGYKGKWIVKTRSAALGVRGTDFLVSYNEKNHITSNVTFRGKVDLYKRSDSDIRESLREEKDQRGAKINLGQGNAMANTNSQLHDPYVERIPQGKFSGAYPSYDKPIAPVRISPTQLKLLAGNTSADFHSKNNTVKNNYNLQNIGEGNNYLVPQPQGEVVLAANDKRGQKLASEQTVRPGGHLDMETGIYVAPPSGSKYDPVKKVYIMPDDLGGVDSKTGAYIAPKGSRLDPLKGFVAVGKAMGAQLAKLNKLAGNLGAQFDKTMQKLKDFSRVDAEISGRYRFTTNALEDYYGEYRFVSGIQSMVWDVDGEISTQLFHNKTWLFKPKAGMLLKYHSRRHEKAVQRNDRLSGMGGAELHHKHTLFGSKARMIADVQLTTTYQDFRNKNQWDFYTEDASLTIKEIFRLLPNQITDISYQGQTYHGFEDPNHGNIHTGYLNHRFVLGRVWDFKLGGFMRVRKDKIDNQHLLFRSLYGKLIRKDLIFKMDFETSYRYTWYNPTLNINFDAGQTYEADFTLARRTGQFIQFEGYYRFIRQQVDDDKDNRQFIQQTWGGGMRILF